MPVGDLNKDGRPDFVALISQEHETVVAFLNEGNGRFRKETIYTAPHPAFGSSGIQLIDLDGQGIAVVFDRFLLERSEYQPAMAFVLRAVHAQQAAR